MRYNFLGTEELQERKKAFLKEYSKKKIETVIDACRAIGVNRPAMSKWCNDPAFEKAFHAIKAKKLLENDSYDEDAVQADMEGMDVKRGGVPMVKAVGYRDRTKEYEAHYRVLKTARQEFEESQMALIKQIAEAEARMDYYKCLMKHPNYRALYPLKTACGGWEWKVNPLEKELREARAQHRAMLADLGVTYATKGYKVKSTQKISFMAKHQRTNGAVGMDRIQA